MAEQNTRTVVCRILDVQPSRKTTGPLEIDHKAAEAAAYDVSLSTGETAYVSPSAVDMVDRLERVKQANLYIYLDLDPAGFIGGDSIAQSGFVRHVTTADDGYYVRLERSAAVHFIPAHPDPTAMVERILSAQYSHQPVALRNASICGTTIDARSVAPIPDMATASVRIARGFDVEERSRLTAVTHAQAIEHFQFLATFTCPAVPPNDTCVPIYYVIFGCQARAHRFCKILGQMQTPVRAAKKWAWAAPLVVTPPNMPCCRILWAVHVAVALRASDRDGYYVLDHALFNAPAAEDEWLDQLVNRRKQTQISAATAYLWEDPSETPIEEISGDTERSLRDARIMQNEMIRLSGPPPYHTCDITTHAAMPGSADPAACSRGAARTPYAPW